MTGTDDLRTVDPWVLELLDGLTLREPDAVVPSAARLAERLGVRESDVQEAIDKLFAAGELTVSSRRRRTDAGVVGAYRRTMARGLLPAGAVVSTTPTMASQLVANGLVARHGDQLRVTSMRDRATHGSSWAELVPGGVLVRDPAMPGAQRAMLRVSTAGELHVAHGDAPWQSLGQPEQAQRRLLLHGHPATALMVLRRRPGRARPDHVDLHPETVDVADWPLSVRVVAPDPATAKVRVWWRWGDLNGCIGCLVGTDVITLGPCPPIGRLVLRPRSAMQISVSSGTARAVAEGVAFVLHRFVAAIVTPATRADLAMRDGEDWSAT